MKTSAIVFMLIATAGSIYLTTTSVIEATDVTRGAVARRDDDPALAEELAADKVSGLIAQLGSPILGENEESLSRDPMVPYRAPRRTTTAASSPASSRPSIRVLALILDESPTAVVRYRGANLAVRVGDPIGSARVTEITDGGIEIADEDGVHTYPYPPRG